MTDDRNGSSKKITDGVQVIQLSDTNKASGPEMPNYISDNRSLLILQKIAEHLGMPTSQLLTNKPLIRDDASSSLLNKQDQERRLLTAFNSITNKDRRNQIINLVQSLAVIK